ncbi:hypothetical protein Scep_005013 [Stephania cephalantha]|uniref:Uncharacterized protein n=1 Tax=Stephania cephalantha TaxID=152367 RepID=A0AAP0PXT3_9MAGN
MKTTAQVRKEQNGKEEDSRSAAWVQTFEVLVGVWTMQECTHEKNELVGMIVGYSRQQSLFYSLSNEMNVLEENVCCSLQQSQSE